MIGYIIAALTIGLIIAGTLINLMNDECPRMIRGYNCKGHDCDHSIIAVEQAKQDMERW